MGSAELFGLAAIAVMVVSYAFEKRHHNAVLIFATACLAAAVYAYLIGSYQFMIAEGIWAVVAFRRWQITRTKRLI